MPRIHAQFFQSQYQEQWASALRGAGKSCRKFGWKFLAITLQGVLNNLCAEFVRQRWHFDGGIPVRSTAARRGVICRAGDEDSIRSKCLGCQDVEVLTTVTELIKCVKDQQVTAVVASGRHGQPGAQGFDSILLRFRDVAGDVLDVRVQGIKDAVNPVINGVCAVCADVVVDDAPGLFSIAGIVCLVCSCLQIPCQIGHEGALALSTRPGDEYGAEVWGFDSLIDRLEHQRSYIFAWQEVL